MNTDPFLPPAPTAQDVRIWISWVREDEPLADRWTAQDEAEVNGLSNAAARRYWALARTYEYEMDLYDREPPSTDPTGAEDERRWAMILTLRRCADTARRLAGF